MPAIGMTTGGAPTKNSGGGTEKKVYEAIPEGTYWATIKSIKHGYVNKEICHWKKHDEEIIFEFVLTDGDYKNRHFWKDVNAVLTEGSHLTLALQEILEVSPLPEGFIFDTDDLASYEGLPVRIRVAKYFSEKKGVEQNSVDDILAPSAKQFASSSASPSQPTYEEPF